MDPTVAPSGPEHHHHSLTQDHLTPDQLAAELGVSLRTLMRWHALRKGPARISVGRLILYRRAAIQDWLASLEKAAADTAPRRRGARK